MKDTVMDVVKTVANSVFSFGGFMFVAGLAFVYLLVAGAEASQAKVRACYNAGMVLVDTDAGNYCVAPTHLVEIK